MSGKVIPIQEAVAKIPDGATVSICGAWMVLPDRLLAAIGESFAATGHPRDLTATFLLSPGGTKDQPGIEHVAKPGLLRRVIGGSFPNLPDSALRRLIAENQIEAYNLPAGMVAGWYREVGAGRPGFLTRRGIGTFVDPRVEGGGMNQRSTEQIVSVVQVGGEECLFFPSAPVNVSLIRATTADTAGNLTMEHESAELTAFVQAAAARASRGVVIAQVKRVVERGALNPHHVKVPGTLVDYVVVEPEPLQAGGIRFDPSLCGETRVPLESIPADPGPDVWLARRAAREVRRDDVVVLGYGISAFVPYLMRDEGRFEDAWFAIEQGSIGGLPLVNFGFGSSANPLAILDAASQFDLFQGSCFDLGILSFLQVDEQGRVNVHRLDARPALSAGIGGFLDIAANARRLVFLGTFTAGGLDYQASESGVVIRKEGRMRKFVKKLDHISFDPAHSQAEEILYITERGVLRWKEGRLELAEIPAGVDAKRDILGQMEFEFS
jgi:acyl CoA:acetate/3-ketoacid CoA transferase